MTRVAGSLVLKARDRGWEFTLPAGCTRVLGRLASKSDICIADLTVASRHARVFEQDGSWCIEDLGSHCGVYVNGRPARGVHRIDAGDTIRLGAVELEVIVRDDAEEKVP